MVLEDGDRGSLLINDCDAVVAWFSEIEVS